MHTIEIERTMLRIIEVYPMAPRAFFSPFTSFSQAKSGDLIGIERRTSGVSDAGLDTLSKSQVITQTPKGPEWHNLLEQMPWRDQVGLKNSFSFQHLENLFPDGVAGERGDTPITILNECLVADFGGDLTCLVRERLSNHECARILTDLRGFIPAWMAVR